MSTPRASKQGRSFQQPRQHPIFDLCFYFTPATSVTPSPRRVLHFTQGQSQHDSRLRAVFSVSPPLQVPLPSDCRFHCRRAGMGNPYSPWHAGMTVSCNYQKMRCSRPRTLCRTTVFAINDSTNLANEHHPMEVGSIDFAARQPVTNNRCPAPKPRHLQDPSA